MSTSFLTHVFGWFGFGVNTEGHDSIWLLDEFQNVMRWVASLPRSSGHPISILSSNVSFACSCCVHGGIFWVLWFVHVPKTCWEVNWRPQIASRCESVYAWCLSMGWHLSLGVPNSRQAIASGFTAALPRKKKKKITLKVNELMRTASFRYFPLKSLTHNEADDEIPI